MTGKEKRDIVLRETIIPAIKNAGYSKCGQTYYRQRRECCMMLRMQNSRFNSQATGYDFWFHIGVLPKEEAQDRQKLKEWWGGIDSVQEDILLPDCGMLNPYRNGRMGYCIDPYKNYQPQDMDIDDIKQMLHRDFSEYILPRLDHIQSVEEWEEQKKMWMMQNDTKRIHLLTYYFSAQMLCCAESNKPFLQQQQKDLHLTAEDIVGSFDLLHQIRKLSKWPEMDAEPFVRTSL
ncbi:DUF4304 domain-containing protein [uncultured Robinsoniella sp.]|uniref:DUF4304 domain-containing protein n=1 Tax=uncultured Robinsoniella sp. TaxID=904190 RepID=UPI00374F5785